MSPSPVFDQVRALVSDRQLEEAIRLLVDYTCDHSEWCDTALLLESTLSDLDTDSIKGIISLEEDRRERNRLADNILNFVRQLETAEEKRAAQPTPAPAHPRPTSPSSPTSQSRSFPKAGIIGAFVLIGALVLWGLSRAFSGNGQPVLPDFEATLEIRPFRGDPRFMPKGMVKAAIGTEKLPEKSIPNDGKIVYGDIAGKFLKDSVTIDFQQVADFDIVSQHTVLGTNSQRILLETRPKMQRYQGKVLVGNKGPAAGAIIDFENGLAVDTTGKDGAFEVEMPALLEGQTVKITLAYRGKTEEKNNLLDAGVLADLKIMRIEKWGNWGIGWDARPRTATMGFAHR